MTAREAAAEARRKRNKRYRESQKGKEATRDSYKRWCKTDKGREARKRNR